MLTSHYYTRGDSLHLFLFSGAIYAYILHSKRKGLRDILLAALFSAGCIMVKQSGILIIGIIGFWLLFIERKWLTLALYGLCTFGFAYVIADAAIDSDWHAMYQNAYMGLKNGTDLSFLSMMFTSQFFLDLVPCYILGGIIVWFAIKQIKDKTFRIVATGVALSFIFATVTGLKIGSSNNYFTEFLLFIIIAVPFLLQNDLAGKAFLKFSNRTLTIKRFTYIALIILITSKTMGIFSAVIIEKSLRNDKEEYEREKALYTYMQNLGLQKGDHIYFPDRLFFDNIFYPYAIMPTKDVVMQVYANSHTTFDYSTFTMGMNNGMIKYIVTDKAKPDMNEWNKYISFIHFDTRFFRLHSTYGPYTIYVYTPRS